MADANSSVVCYFAGPDDSESCGGCSDAVDGNPYTLDDVPEPGSFQCMGRCRHFVQIDGDAPEGVQTLDWSADSGFTDSVNDVDAAEGNEAQDSADDVGDAATAGDNNDLSDDEQAVAAMSSPMEIATYILSNELTLEDVDSVLSNDERDAVQDELAAQGYTENTETLSDMLDGRDLSAILSDDDAEAKELAAAGFDSPEKAYYLADALNDDEPDMQWKVEYDGLLYYVTSSDTRLNRNVRESVQALRLVDTTKLRLVARSKVALMNVREGGVDQPRDDHGRWSAGGAPGGTWRDNAYVGIGKVDLVDLNFLKSIQGNALGKTDVTELADTIKTRGLDQPLVMQFNHKNGLIKLAEGNHRVAALLQLGYTHAPVQALKSAYLDHDDEGTRKIAFNQIADRNGYVPSDMAPSALSPEIPTKPMNESMREGGEGSGNHGHAGRPGQIGGSGSGGNSLKTLPEGTRIVKRAEGIYSVVLGEDTITKFGTTYAPEVARVSLNDAKTYVTAVHVEKDYRRQGIASAMYDHIEKDIGHALVPSETHQTTDGYALWKARRG